jgi:predicted ArsR family transcriptional regulator
MMTATSIEAHHAREPNAKHERARVLGLLKRFGSGTAKEIATASGEDFPPIQKRLSELTDEGSASRVEFRVCRITGRRATVWQAKISSGSTPPPPVESRAPAAAPSVAAGVLSVVRAAICGCGTINPCKSGRHCQATGHEECACGAAR